MMALENAGRRQARPLICLVTDRRRLCSALRRPLGDWQAVLEAQMAGAVAGGIDLVQIRERDLDAGELRDFISRASGRVPGLLSKLVVNDRLDVALAAEAAGVHLRETSFAATDVRSVVPPGFLVGRSVHGSSPSESYRDASYVVAGAVFPTGTKTETHSMLGLDGLRRVVDRAGGVPVIAIGGLTATSVGDLVSSGAGGFAAIGWFVPEGPAAIDEFVKKQVSELRFAFDSTGAPT